MKVKVKSLSRVRLFATPWTVAHQAPSSMGFSRQEYWGGLPFLDWMKHKLESRLQGEISKTSDDTTLMAENEELRSLLMNVKEESEKVVLKLNIQKTKIMASCSITSWQIDGETVTDYFFGLLNHCRW